MFDVDKTFQIGQYIQWIHHLAYLCPRYTVIINLKTIFMCIK